MVCNTIMLKHNSETASRELQCGQVSRHFNHTLLSPFPLLFWSAT